MGPMDLLKSERGVMNLIFLGVLAALMFTGADKDTINTWAIFAGGSTSIYTVAKSMKPNDAKTTTTVKVEAGPGDGDKRVETVKETA